MNIRPRSWGRSGRALGLATCLALSVPIAAEATEQHRQDSNPGSTAQPSGLVLVSEKRTLQEDEGGSGTASLTVINTGAAQRLITFAPAESACQVEDDSWLIPGSRQETRTIELLDSCDIDDEGGQDIGLVVDGQEFASVHLEPPPAPATPKWDVVAESYVHAAIAALVLLALAWLVPPSRDKHSASLKALKQPLPGLAASWKFSDSWASNATVVTALFTGVFASKDVVAVILGDKAEDVLAVALVTSAFSLGLAGLAPLLVQSLQTRVRPKPVPSSVASFATGSPPGANPAQAPKPGLYVTPAGLLVAALVTLTATSGQLLTLLRSLKTTDVWSDELNLVGVAALALLAVYGFVATRQNLETGLTPPPAADPEDGKKKKARDKKGQEDEKDQGDGDREEQETDHADVSDTSDTRTTELGWSTDHGGRQLLPPSALPAAIL